MGLIIFSLPLAIRSLKIAGNYGISFVALMIVFFFIGFYVKGEKRPTKTPHKGLIFIITLSLLCSSLTLSIKGLPANVSLLEDIDKNIFRFINTILASNFLYILLVKNVHSKTDWLFYAKSFLYSIVFLFVIFVAVNAFNIKLPNFFMPTVVDEYGRNIERDALVDNITIYGKTRFAGYIGFYENFVEYLIIIMSFAIITIASIRRFFSYEKLLGLVCIILSLWFGLFTTATRSFPILIGILILIFLIFQVRIRQLSRVFLWIAMLGFAMLIILNSSFWIDSYMYERFTSEWDWRTILSSPMNFLYYSGRQDLVLYFRDVLSLGGAFGVGPLIIHSVYNSNIVFHNLYYSVYISLGLFGLISILAFFFVVIRDLLGILGNKQTNTISIILIAIIITLLIDGLKVTFLRSPQMVYIFWFVFAMSVSFSRFNYRGKTDNKNDKDMEATEIAVT
ncbi:hypothetical protein FJZ33_00605 [Candidatus Poribacteria bacterium]|nr:hypothetical protein [Candidatus Poribacteria bacterium]